MDIVSYNCQNLKSNVNMVRDLILNNDVCFFIEHWLGEEEAFYFNELSDEHQILFEADYSCEARLRCDGAKGRPFGGRCWVVRNCLRVLEYESLSKVLSKITIEDLKGSRVSIFGVWQPFDDGSVMRFSNLQSNLSMLSAELMHLDDTCAIVMGDFNADFTRGKRFDKEIGAFMKQHKFERLVLSASASLHTYSSGTKLAVIDHMFANSTALSKIVNFRVIVDELDLSDHRPIACTVELGDVEDIPAQGKCNKLHRFNWKNLDFVEEYADGLEVMLKELLAEYGTLEVEAKRRIDFLHNGVTGCMLKSARRAERKCGLVTSNGVWRSRCKFSINTPEITKLSNELKSRDVDKVERQVLRKQLRRAQRRRIFQSDGSRSHVIGKLLYEDRSKFWKEVTKAKRCNARRAPVINSKPSALDFVKYYKTLFSHHDRPSSAEHQKIAADVRMYAETLKECVEFDGFSVDLVSNAIGDLNSGKAAGFNGISNEFFIYGNSMVLVNVLHTMYNMMMKTGILPTGFNTALLTPIPKSKEISAPFGYKRATSCKSAYYVVNETISYYKSGRSNCHVISLDAAKA